MKGLACILCLLCSWCIAALSQPLPNDAWALSQWQRRNWQIEDGLPHNYVTAITQDDGRLLIGTKSGIVLFDGFEFTPYAFLKDVWITAFLRTTNGDLWVATHDQGLYRISNGAAKFIAPGSFIALSERPDHAVWTVSLEGAGPVANDQFELALRGLDTGVYGWQPVDEDADGDLLFAAQEGLLHLKGGRKDSVRLHGVAGTPVTVYSLPGSHDLWLGTTAGLFRLACTELDCNATQVNGVKGPVVSMRWAYDRTLWIATWGHGLYRLSGSGLNQVENLDIGGGLADEFVRTLYEDNERNMWVGTRGGGLTRFRTTILKPFGIAEGMEGNCASAAVGDGEGDGGVWLGTWRSGLFHWTGGKMVQQALPRDRLGVLITTLALNSARDLWIGSFSGSWVLRHGNSTAEPLSGPLATASVRKLLFARDNSLWILKEDGELFHYASGDPSTSAPQPVLATEHVTQILEGADQTLWIGTSNGLWRVRSAQPPTRVASSASPVVSLSQDSQGRLWVAHDNGNTDVHRSGETSSLPASVLPNKLLYNVMQDAAGNVWFSTGLGLAWLPGEDVDRILRGNGAGIQAVRLGVSDGARTIECRCAQTPQAWAGADGAMWIPTSRGFLQADPRRIGKTAGPRASIESIRWDGGASTVDTRAILPAGSHNLEVRFSSVRLGTADEVSFRYRLQGVDDRWIAADRDRIARYPQLPPGKHHFLIAARDSMGDWGETTNVLLEQQPHLYQTIWFACLIIALIPLALVVGHNLRMRGMHKRYSAVLEERGRIAREWHDTLLAGLAAIAWQLDGAIHNCSQPQLSSALKNARSMLRYCTEEARMAVEGLRKESIHSDDITKALEDTLVQATDGKPVHHVLTVSPSVPAISEEVRHALLRICQEASSNAVRHAAPTQVLVQFEYIASMLTLRITDDGAGMDPALLQTVPAGHFGILGMRERMQRVGGKLDISTSPRGTVVEAKVKVSR